MLGTESNTPAKRNHPKSSEVFELLDKFATVAVINEGGDTGGKTNDR